MSQELFQTVPSEERPKLQKLADALQSNQVAVHLLGSAQLAWDEATDSERMAPWRKAAICASLKRMTGSRTDLDGAQTLIERFCHEANGGKGMSRDHFSRIA